MRKFYTSKIFTFVFFISSVLASKYVSALEPLIYLNENANFRIVSSAFVNYESNVFKTSDNHKEDYYLVLSPGGELKFANECSPFSGKIFFREDFYLYKKFTRLNRHDANLYIDLNYRDCSIDVATYGSFVQVGQNSGDPNLLEEFIRSNNTNAGLKVVIPFADDKKLETGYDFLLVDYKAHFSQPLNSLATPFEDRALSTVPLVYYYEVIPRLEIGPFYRYRYTDIQTEIDFNDHFFGLALRGEICSTWRTDLLVGYLYHNVNRRFAVDTMGLQSKTTWQPFECFRMQLDLYRDFITGSSGESIKDTGFFLNVLYSFDRCLEAHVGIGYERSVYEPFQKFLSDIVIMPDTPSVRKDGTTRANAGISWLPFSFMKIDVGYEFIFNDSNIFGCELEAHRIFAGTTLRF